MRRSFRTAQIRFRTAPAPIGVRAEARAPGPAMSSHTVVPGAVFLYGLRTVSRYSLGAAPAAEPSEAPFLPSVLGSRFRGCKSKGGTVQTANRAAHPIFPAEKPRQPASAPKRSTVGHQTQKADSSEPQSSRPGGTAVLRSAKPSVRVRRPSAAGKSRARRHSGSLRVAAPEFRLFADQRPSATRQLRHSPHLPRTHFGALQGQSRRPGSTQHRHSPCRAAAYRFRQKLLSAASPAQVPAPPPAPHPASTNPCRRRSRCRDVRRRFLR